MTDKKSPTVELLTQVWNGVHDNKAMWSWARLNRCMHDALDLAIEAGMEFQEDDITFIANEFRWGYWASGGEGFYCHAVAEDNMSAIKALEKYYGRIPFIVDNVTQAQNYSSNVHRTRGRLAVRSEFWWDDRRVTVTSFNDKQGVVNCVTYKPHETDSEGKTVYSPRKIDRRYRLSHDDLKKGKVKIK